MHNFTYHKEVLLASHVTNVIGFVDVCHMTVWCRHPYNDAKRIALSQLMSNK